jgi:hypothetical protein
MLKFSKILIVAITLVFCCSLAVQAALISTGQINIVSDPSQSTDNLGTFTATLEYFFDNANSAIGELKVINLANTGSDDGKITGFVMNNPGAISSITTFTTTNANFLQLGMSNNGVPGNPFGDFDFGAALGGDFLGGGSPNGGIHVGFADSFTFDFSGAALNTLTTQSFINALSNNPATGKNAQFFLARFRGFTPDGSDKVPAIVVAPIPGSLVLLGSALLGLVGWRRKLS